jgi:hypothetical protein
MSSKEVVTVLDKNIHPNSNHLDMVPEFVH